MSDVDFQAREYFIEILGGQMKLHQTKKDQVFTHNNARYSWYQQGLQLAHKTTLFYINRDSSIESQIEKN